MKVKDLIKLLKKQDPESTLYIDADEGELLLPISSCYEEGERVVLYGSVMDIDE